MFAGNQALRVRQYPVIIGITANCHHSLIHGLFRTLAWGDLVITSDSQTQRHLASLLNTSRAGGSEDSSPDYPPATFANNRETAFCQHDC
ncbi:hypothetical protein D3C76_1511420 [compost metagenome]